MHAVILSDSITSVISIQKIFYR